MDKDFDDKKIIPQPAEKDTRWYVTIERIRSRLPSLEGQAGRTLKVSADEEHCEWVAGGSGGPVAFADLTGSPSDNPALKSDLDAKLTRKPGSPDFEIGVDPSGQLYFEVP